MYYIGIDLGGTVIKIGLIFRGQIIACDRLDANSKIGLRSRLDSMAQVIDSFLRNHNVLPNDLGGIFLAFPGIVDVSKKRAVSTNAKYNDAPDVNLEEWCLMNWNVPFAIDNDARAALVGEWKLGVARDKKNVVMMTIGTGIGTGVIIEGRLLYGQHYRAGSLGGHLIVDYRGRRCTCGNIGCVEAYGSSYFLPQIIAENSRLKSEFRQEAVNFSFKELFELASVGNVEARKTVEDCMDVWSAAIVNYIHAYDPQMVILGGGVMKSEKQILPYIRTRVNDLAWCPNEKVEIVSSVLGDNAALLAAEYYLNVK